MGLRRRLVASGSAVDNLRPRRPAAASPKRNNESSSRNGVARKQRRGNSGSTEAPVPVAHALPPSSARDGPAAVEAPSASNAVPALERIADQLTRLADCGDRIVGLLERQA